MQNFKILKCPSCGSSVIESKNEKLAECSHCGSKLLFNDSKLRYVNGQYSKLIVSLLVVIILGGILGFYITQQREPIKEINPKIEIPKIGIPDIKFNLPKVNSKAMTITADDLNTNNLIEPKVTIVHQVQGKTIIGGLYWIITVRNDNDKSIVRPSIIASLFDENNKRIEEQKSWAKLTQLQPGQQTDILVLISNPPQIKYTSKFKATAKFSSALPNIQEMIEVQDFTIKPNSHNTRNVDIIGNVKNNKLFQVDFVRIVAIAKDKQGNTIGLADGFVSNLSLAPNTQSGFKIKAGTFVTQPPDSWSLWAFGMKHQKPL